MLLIDNLVEAEKFVSRQQKINAERGSTEEVRWDGWDMVFFRPDPRGRKSKDGALRNGEWGFDNRVSPNEEGYQIDWRNVKRARRTRN